MLLHLINPPEVPGYISDRDKAGGLGTMFAINRRYRYRAFTPPLDLLYTAAVAERVGIRVEFTDALAERLDADGLMSRLKESKGLSHVGVRLSLPSLTEDLELADRIKRELGVKVVLFGNVIQTTYDRWLSESQADYVLFGEAEGLIEDVLAGRPNPHVWDAQTRQTPFGWYLIKDLNALPFPAWHLAPLPLYSVDGTVGGMTFYLLTSRGCPKACSMCPYYVHQGGPWRQRTVENVLAELDWLQKLGARMLQCRDPNIGLVKPRLRAIASAMAERNYGFQWVIETDLESLDPQTIQTLAASGLTRLMTGIESADPQILRDIHQHPEALKLTLANIERCHDLGIDLTGFMVVGSTSESFETVVATVRMAQKLPMNYSVSLMTPYLGTVYRKEAEEMGHVQPSSNWRRYSGTQCLIRTKYLSQAEVELAYRWATGELESTRRWRSVQQSRGLKAGWNLVRWAKHRLWHAGTDIRFGLARQAKARAMAPALSQGNSEAAS